MPKPEEYLRSESFGFLLTVRPIYGYDQEGIDEAAARHVVVVVHAAPNAVAAVNTALEALRASEGRSIVGSCWSTVTDFAEPGTPVIDVNFEP